MTTYNLDNGSTLQVIHDSNASSPREDDNLGTMVCFHNRYNLGDKHGYSTNDFDGWESMKAALIREHDAAIILPLYLYDHSGITMRTTPFGCPWDSGQVGFIYISKAKIRKEYSVKKINKALLERVTGYLVAEVKVYDEYLTGEIYGFKEIDKEGKEVDSCWGFYGSDPKENGMLDNIDAKIID